MTAERRAKLVELLAENAVFHHLNESNLERVCDLAIARHYQKGETIAYYGDVWPYLFLVQAGGISGVKESEQGRTLVVITLGPGEVFWGLAFFMEQSRSPVSLVADVESRVFLWNREDLMPILLDDGRMSWELSRLMVERMQRASDIVEKLAFQTVSGRLARLILDHYQDAVEATVSRDLTLDEMAARIGTTREIVCRGLYRFMDDGAIEINRTEFKIINPSVLEEHAGTVKG